MATYRHPSLRVAAIQRSEAEPTGGYTVNGFMKLFFPKELSRHGPSPIFIAGENKKPAWPKADQHAIIYYFHDGIIYLTYVSLDDERKYATIFYCFLSDNGEHEIRAHKDAEEWVKKNHPDYIVKYQRKSLMNSYGNQKGGNRTAKVIAKQASPPNSKPRPIQPSKKSSGVSKLPQARRKTKCNYSWATELTRLLRR